MKFLSILGTSFFCAIALTWANAAELEEVEYRILAQQSIERDGNEQTRNIWTTSQQEASQLLAEVGIEAEIQLAENEILVVYFVDGLGLEFTDFLYHKTAAIYFADFTFDGIRYHPRRPPEGKKDSQLVALVFKAEKEPRGIMRRTIQFPQNAQESQRR